MAILPNYTDAEFISIIKNIVKSASKIILERKALDITNKNDFDFVTQIDVEVQEQIKRELADYFPQVGFLGEEGNKNLHLNGPTWILDPVDGTTNFIFDRNYSCISLAYFDGKTVSFGLIYEPYNDEYFVAIKGQGAFCNDRCLQVRTDTEPKQCLLLASGGSSNKSIAWQQMTLLRELQQEIIDLRISGSGALNFAYLAAGRASAFIAPPMWPWDGAAGVLLVREAGGVVHNYAGENSDFLQKSSTVAGNEALVEWLHSKINQDRYEELRKLCI